jgi:hypothetical protein
MSPQDKHNDETIIKNIESINSINPIYSQYNKFITNLEKSIGKELSIEENKQAKAYFYSLVYSQS